MTSIIMILMYLKYHVFNFLLESKNQNFNSSNKPVKPIKNYYLERFILIIFKYNNLEKKNPCVLPKRFLLAHPLRLPLRLQDSLLLLAGTATWLGNPRLREVILAGASP